MLDLSLAELLFIGLVALVVIGPKDLPKVLSAVMKLFRQVQEMATELRQNVDEMVKESGVEDVKRDVKYLVDQQGDLQEIYDVKETLELDTRDDPSPESAQKSATLAPKTEETDGRE